MVGQCCLRPLRKYILPDQEVLLNAKKLMERDSDQPTLAVQAEQCEAVESLQKAWAPKGSRKAARFTRDQRKYLEDKFRIGQETGHKADPEQVAREMRYDVCATKEASADSRWMSFLTAEQIQSFFSRPAANLRHAVAPEDDDEETDDNSRAAEEEEAFLDARNTILVQCAPVHAIVYDTWKLCAMSSSNKLSKVTVAQLREICSHFNRHGG